MNESSKNSNKILIRNVNVYYSDTHAIKNVDMEILENTVTALIGPSGCGKSTLLRCFNRMNEEIAGCRTTGKIIWHGTNILDNQVDPVALRRKVGLVFQKPNPFPKSVYENVAYGPRIHSSPDKKVLNKVVEKSLKDAALWNEVKDMYKQLDSMIGEIINHVDEDTIVVLSSDHGAVPLNKSVRLNNLFAKKGWLRSTINPTTGEPIINWENPTVIYLKMDNIYISPSGLAGNWIRSSGEIYEKLREEVMQ